MAQPILEIQADARHSQSAMWYKDWLLTAGQDKAIKAWRDGELAWQLDGHEATSYGLSRHGDQLLSGSSDHTLRCWDLAKREALWVAEGVDFGTWSPDGTFIVAHKKSKRIAILDQDGVQTCLLPAAEKRILASGWSGRTVLLGGAKDIHQFDGADPVAVWRGHGGAVTNIATGPNWIASAAQDRQLIFWNPDATIAGKVAAPPGVGLSWNHDGTKIAKSSDHRLAVYAVPSGDLVWETAVPLKGVYGPGFSPDGKQIAVACADGRVRIYAL